MVDGNFVFMLILLLLNFILCLKKIPEDFPLVNLIVTLFTLIITVSLFLPDSSIPANPYSSAFLGLITVIQLIINVLNTKV